MKKNLFTLMVLSLSISTLFAQQPKSVKDFPVYPGAVIDKAATQVVVDETASRVTESHNEYLEKRAEFYFGEFREIAGMDIVVYSTDALVDTVIAWYAEKLGKPGSDFELPVWSELKSQELSQIRYGIYYYDVEKLYTTYAVSDYDKHDGKLFKSLVATRPGFKTDKVVSNADFSWVFHRTALTGTQFEVTISDASFPEGLHKKAYKQKTTIQIIAINEKNHPDWAMSAHCEETKIPEFEALADNPPTEATMGIPFYPGAKLGFNDLIMMSAAKSPYKMYPYTVASPLAKVLSFYEGKTGKKASAGAPGVYNLLIKGTDAKNLELGVMIQKLTETDTLIILIKK